MKRIISAILMLCTLISLASCGGGEDKKTGKDDKPANIMAWAFHSFEKTVANVKPRGNDFSTDYTVYLSKGETEGCQVAIYSDKKIENATLTKKSGGADNIEVSVFSMNITHSVSKYQYTDSLIPYSGKALTLEAKTILPFMIEFKTNENTEAGEHNYVYEFKDGKGNVLATYNVTVHVWDFELPNEKTFVTAFGLGKHWIAYQGIYNAEIHAEWYDIMLEHNMCAYEIPYDILDDRANDYMSNPRVTSFMVPIPKNEDGSIDEAKLIATYNKLLTNDVWLSKAYFYPLDEPKNVKELAALKEWEKKLTALCPEIEIMAPYYTNIQLGEGRDQTDEMAEYTDLWCPKLCLWDDVKSYGGFLNYTPSKSFAERMAEQQAKGDRMWSYVCNDPDDPYAQMFIDTEGVVQRLMFWQVYQRDIEGFLYWSVNSYGYKEGNAFMQNATPQNPWETTNTKVTTADGKTIFGCGFLFYPGREVRAGLVVPSIRAKIVRDGVDDIEMFYLAEKYLDKDWIVNKTKEGTPTLTEYADGDKYVSLRIEIGNALEEAMRK
ncbi:MAG: DUF4091 domain-containing protein [Ruminococcaceae bacterium]|nr:DUF4091 domain-containing protein [Oscillospiraceae bacterium]